MTPNAPAAADTPLSVEEAVGLLDAGRPEDDDEQISEAAPTAEDGEDPGDSDAQAILGDDEAEEGDPEEAPVIAPPRSWDAQARAAFAKLPPDIQEVIALREGERDRAVSRAQQEAGDARRRAEDEAEAIARHTGALEQLILRGQATFQDRWSDFDQNFPALVDQHGAEQVLKWRAQRDHELGELARLNAAHQDAARHQRARFLDTETRRLAELSPDLGDPKTGGERRERLARWLVEQGVDPRALPDLDARTVALAYDAMRFRLGHAKVNLAKVQQSRPTPAPARPGVKPTAAEARRPQSRTAETAKARFAQTRSVDDAVALLNARSG
jgi:hypothetical protein